MWFENISLGATENYEITLKIPHSVKTEWHESWQSCCLETVDNTALSLFVEMIVKTNESLTV